LSEKPVEPVGIVDVTVTDLEKSKGKYQYVKDNVDPGQLAEEIKTALGVEANVWWYSPDKLHIDTVDLTVEQKAKLDEIVEVHTPTYVCGFCGVDQGSCEKLGEHKMSCFREKLAEATTVEEKVALIEKVVG